MSDPQAVIAQLIRNGDEWLEPESIRGLSEAVAQLEAFTQAVRDAGLALGEMGAAAVEFQEAWKDRRKK